VDRSLCQANHLYVRDYIKIFVATKRIDNSTLRSKYLDRNVSSAQLGQEVGLSKQAVLRRLREAGVTKSKGRGRSDENYRFPNPPFGKSVANGRLETCNAEMKIVRLIVELRDRRIWTFEKIAKELNDRGYRSRKKLEWTRYSVKRVHNNWTGKV
jgi:hypothetical protein